MTDRVLLVVPGHREDGPLPPSVRVLAHDFTTHVAAPGVAALGAVSQRGPYAAIVVEGWPPTRQDLPLWNHVRAHSPETVVLALVQPAAVPAALAAVNDGTLFRVLLQPASIDAIAVALRAAARHYRRLRGDNDVLDRTMLGAIKVLTDVLALVSPQGFGRASRVRRLVRQIADAMGVERPWELEVAALLSQVGSLTIPEDVLMRAYRGIPLSSLDRQAYTAHPLAGGRIVASIPGLGDVAELITYQDKRFDGRGRPASGLVGSQIPLGARILKLALDADALHFAGVPELDALEELRARDGWYDPIAVEALATVLTARTEYRLRSLALADIKPGMILAGDIVDPHGVLLVARDQEVTLPMLGRLRHFARTARGEHVASVLVPETLPADVTDEHSLPEDLGALDTGAETAA